MDHALLKQLLITVYVPGGMLAAYLVARDVDRVRWRTLGRRAGWRGFGRGLLRNVVRTVLVLGVTLLVGWVWWQLESGAGAA